MHVSRDDRDRLIFGLLLLNVHVGRMCFRARRVKEVGMVVALMAGFDRVRLAVAPRLLCSSSTCRHGKGNDPFEKESSPWCCLALPFFPPRFVSSLADHGLVGFLVLASSSDCGLLLRAGNP